MLHQYVQNIQNNVDNVQNNVQLKSQGNIYIPNSSSNHILVRFFIIALCLTTISLGQLMDHSALYARHRLERVDLSSYLRLQMTDVNIVLSTGDL